MNLDWISQIKHLSRKQIDPGPGSQRTESILTHIYDTGVTDLFGMAII
ncbi:hypothetical protein [Spirosoma linguale]|uniref:Uncharacterized protein n=1 Tax=Spirosoma linguale (strain ATCC 33905 / DSM 74 / LMG 10896 / Claus 1) TaxID=504472 RepID=D2QVT9_SPILD|nr:hypothetical protein Slin_6977 [Spirosoma linguale DSM 74]